MGFTKNQIKLIGSYLKNRRFLFFVNGSYASKPCNLSSGVPQGSVLGPILWLTYINDMPLVIHPMLKNKRPSEWNRLLLFADDSTTSAANKNMSCLRKDLCNQIKAVQHWSDTNDCILAPEKTKILTNGKFGDIKIKSNTIEKVKDFKYVGIRIDKNLSGKPHIEERIEKS